jgi:hypothetical protein
MFGETVTLSRGGSTVSGVTASWFLDPTGNAIERTARSLTASDKRKWTVAKSAYTLGTPQRGDRITDGDDTEWELLPDGDKEAWQDNGSDWLLFTKRTGELE